MYENHSLRIVVHRRKATPFLVRYLNDFYSSIDLLLTLCEKQMFSVT